MAIKPPCYGEGAFLMAAHTAQPPVLNMTACEELPTDHRHTTDPLRIRRWL